MERGDAVGELASSLIVVAGPIRQPAPIDVAPTRVVAGPITVSSPISTPASTRIDSGASKVTPALRMVLEDAALAEALGLHQLHAAVHAQRAAHVVGEVRATRLAAVEHHREDARSGSARRPPPRPRRARGHSSAASNAYVPMLISPIASSSLGHAVGHLGLHDPLHRPVRPAHDAPVPLRVELLGGEQRGRRAVSVRGSRPAARSAPARSAGGRPRAPRRCRRAPLRASARIAAPVPSPSVCSATVTPSGRPSATPSPGRVMQTTSVAPAARAASITHSTIGRPQTGCRTLGSEERMRVPLPAAMISAVNGAGMPDSGYRRPGQAGMWQTASTLFPSGSSTKAP